VTPILCGGQNDRFAFWLMKNEPSRSLMARPLVTILRYSFIVDVTGYRVGGLYYCAPSINTFQKGSRAAAGRGYTHRKTRQGLWRHGEVWFIQ
jgi:hypothetical protein